MGPSLRQGHDLLVVSAALPLYCILLFCTFFTTREMDHRAKPSCVSLSRTLLFVSSCIVSPQDIEQKRYVFRCQWFTLIFQWKCSPNLCVLTKSISSVFIILIQCLFPSLNCDFKFSTPTLPLEGKGSPTSQNNQGPHPMHQMKFSYFVKVYTHKIIVFSLKAILHLSR